MKRTREPEHTFGLSGRELTRLATFNAEVHRGLVHTPEVVAEMRTLQTRFDEAQALAWANDPHVVSVWDAL